MATILVSKFRSLFWIRMLTKLIGGIFIIGTFINFSIVNGRIDFTNFLLWPAGFGTIALIVFLLNFLFVELREFTVSDEGILIKYLISNQETTVLFENIKKFTPRNLKGKQEFNTTSGYFSIEMELDNGQIIIFNDVQYLNYNEIKNCIYQHLKSE